MVTRSVRRETDAHRESHRFAVERVTASDIAVIGGVTDPLSLDPGQDGA
jgi:hypothetical protein